MRQTKDVRGSPQPWGYVHQRVSHSCDLYFIKKLQSATELLPSFPNDPHWITFRGYSTGTQTVQTLSRYNYIPESLTFLETGQLINTYMHDSSLHSKIFQKAAP